LFQFEFRKKGGSTGIAAAKPLIESQPVESRGARDRPVTGREHSEVGRTSPPRDSVKARSKETREKPPAVPPPVREWDRHKLKQSPPRERDDREKRAREEKLVKSRDKKEADRRERDRLRHEHRGREKNDKSG